MGVNGLIHFGQYLPDLPDLNNPGVTVAKNVFPAANGYDPWPTLQAFSDALTARPRGGFFATDKDGNVRVYAGDATKLYELADAAWSNVSQGGGSDAYSLAEEETWEFAKFGEKILACSGVNADTAIPNTNDIQIITMGGSAFADLGGTPPQARHIAAVRDFIVVGNTWDVTDGLVPQRVRWSGKGNEATWTVSATTQADFEDSLNGGWCQRVVGGEYGVVFMESSIYRMTYVGSPVIWQFDEVAPGQGCIAPGSVAQFGDTIYYLSADGFDKIEHGSQVTHIGANRVDATFFKEFDQTFFYRISATIDPNNHRVFWAYPTSAATGGRPDRVLVYDWSVDKWAFSEQQSEGLFISATSGFTMDGLDAVNTNLDLIVESLDSRIWQGGAEQTGVFDKDFKLSFWNGTSLDAVIETNEFEVSPGRRSLMKAIRPIIDGGTTTVQVGHRNRQQDTFSFTPATSVNANGRATMRKNARYHRVRCNITGSFEHAMGVQVDARPSGMR